MSETSNGYTSGIFPLTLNGSNCNMFGIPLDFSNKCFAFYYKARKNIDLCPDSTHKSLMLSALAECATSCGGVADLAAWSAYAVGEPRSLIDTMLRFNADGKKWKLKAKGVYFATDQSPVYTGSMVADAPLSLKIFAEAVNAKFATLASLVQKHNDLAAAVAAAKTTDGIKAGLDKILDTAEKSKPLLWLAHPAFEEKVLGATESALGFAGTVSRALDYLAKAGSTFQVTTGGKAMQLTGLKIAAGMIPVFGDFYASAIEMIPTLTDWAHGIVKQEVDILAPIYGKEAGQIFSGWQAYQ